MRKYKYRVVCLLLLLLPAFGNTQFVSLPKDATFSFGDNPAWSAPGFDDSGWMQQQLAKSFTKDSSYAWYRIRVVIPASLKTRDGRGLKLMLGKIDDADQTWFNGKKDRRKPVPSRRLMLHNGKSSDFTLFRKAKCNGIKKI